MAFDQEKVEIASAVIVVVGKLDAHKDAPEILAEAPEQVRKSTVSRINGYFEGRQQAQRDEAIRSASLAAMTLMLAAYDMGYATGPMIGFDPVGVGKFVGLGENHLPVMLVVLGKQIGAIRPRAFRYPPSEVVKLESLDGPGLA
jgi:putative NAD(P)H nitroreductase